MKRTAIIFAVLATLIPSNTANAATGTCPKLETLIHKHGLPVKEFSRIAYRESRCKRMAVGWNYRQGHGPKDCRKEPFRKYLRDCGRYLESFDSGIWQVNSTWTSLTIELCGKSPRDGALFDVGCNMKVTAYLYRHGGLAHWAASSSAAKNGD